MFMWIKVMGVPSYCFICCSMQNTKSDITIKSQAAFCWHIVYFTLMNAMKKYKNNIIIAIFISKSLIQLLYEFIMYLLVQHSHSGPKDWDCKPHFSLQLEVTRHPIEVIWNDPCEFDSRENSVLYLKKRL